MASTLLKCKQGHYSMGVLVGDDISKDAPRCPACFLEWYRKESPNRTMNRVENWLYGRVSHVTVWMYQDVGMQKP